MDKIQMLNTVLEGLRAMAARAEDARRKAQEEANAHLGRLESRYDTFKEEAQYLEAAQQQRASTIAEWIRMLEELKAFRPEMFLPAREARVGAVVFLAALPGDEIQCYFLLPAAVGDEIPGRADRIQPLSMGSPLARRLLGRKVGDRIALGNSASERQFQIVEVA